MCYNTCMKTCTGCKESKPLDEFGIKRGKPNPRCKACINLYYKNYWKNTEAYEKHKNRTRNRPNRQKERASKYGLTEEELVELFKRNDGVCESCDTNPAVAVDHCHETGKVRGILCFGCNTGIGKLGDTIAGLKRALAYLERAAEA